MTKISTMILAGSLALACSSAFANEGANASAVQTKTVTVPKADAPVKAPVLLDRRAPSRLVVRVVHEPVAAPRARKAAMTETTRFIFTSPKNTNTKTYRPAAPKRVTMPNHFRD